MATFTFCQTASTSLKSIPSLSRIFQLQTRDISSSPFGRTHVWKRRPRKLPPPVVPQFPQRVIRSDGSTFIHWTTSPRSVIRLTRDVTNNPTWNAGVWKNAEAEDEDESTGRLGRFTRRFGGAGDNPDLLEGLTEVLEMEPAAELEINDTSGKGKCSRR